jgi:hypothetical protein
MAYTPVFDEFGNEVSEDGEVLREGPTGTRDVIVRQKEPLEYMVRGMTAGGALPIHLAMAKEFNISTDVMSSYTGTPWVDVKRYLNKPVRIIGAALWYSGLYSPKEPKFDGELREGYYKVLLKLAEQDVMKDTVIDRKVYNIPYNIIIQTSSKKVAELAIAMILEHGWFDWPDGVSETVVFSGDQDQGYLMRTIGDISKFVHVGKE